MIDEGNVEAVRAAVAALNDGDIDGYLRHFERSCHRWIAGLDRPFGLDDIADNLHHLLSAFDRLRLDEEAIFGADGLVCARWCLRGAHVNEFLDLAATGCEIAVQSCEVYALTGSRVTEVWTYQDPLEIFRQIGAVPRGGAAA